MISHGKSVNKRGSPTGISLGSRGTSRDTCLGPKISHWFARVLAILVVNCMFVTTVQAQQPPPLNKDFEEKSWEEQKQQLPGYPKEPNLKQIDVGPITSFRFYVDTESVNIGTDGVVRFTLMARSDRGATNVTYEGLRCQTQERKMYAIGRADGTWVAPRNPGWVFLERKNINLVLTVLYEDFFCPDRVIASSTKEAVDAINNGGHRRGRTRRGLAPGNS